MGLGKDRNQPCHCGSGKKFKNCCGKTVMLRKLTENGKVRAFILMVQKLGGSIEFSNEELENLDFDQVITEYNPVKDSFRLTCKRSDNIVMPQKKILQVN